MSSKTISTSIQRYHGNWNSGPKPIKAKWKIFWRKPSEPESVLRKASSSVAKSGWKSNHTCKWKGTISNMVQIISPNARKQKKNCNKARKMESRKKQRRKGMYLLGPSPMSEVSVQIILSIKIGTVSYKFKFVNFFQTIQWAEFWPRSAWQIPHNPGKMKIVKVGIQRQHSTITMTTQSKWICWKI